MNERDRTVHESARSWVCRLPGCLPASLSSLLEPCCSERHGTAQEGNGRSLPRGHAPTVPSKRVISSTLFLEMWVRHDETNRGRDNMQFAALCCLGEHLPSQTSFSHHSLPVQSPSFAHPWTTPLPVCNPLQKPCKALPPPVKGLGQSAWLDEAARRVAGARGVSGRHGGRPTDLWNSQQVEVSRTWRHLN